VISQRLYPAISTRYFGSHALPGNEDIDVKFSSTEEFELHVHKCFGKIFELLQKVDTVVKEAADKEEAENTCGINCELRDWIEESILYCHLAWQYHRLTRVSGRNTWDRLEDEYSRTEKPSDDPP